MHQYASASNNSMLNESTSLREVSKEIIVFRVFYSNVHVPGTRRRELWADGYNMGNRVFCLLFNRKSGWETGINEYEQKIVDQIQCHSLSKV